MLYRHYLLFRLGCGKKVTQRTPLEIKIVRENKRYDVAHSGSGEPETDPGVDGPMVDGPTVEGEQDNTGIYCIHVDQ